MIGLVVGADEHVGAWLAKNYNVDARRCDYVLGLVDERRNICGAILWHFYTGLDVQIGYYGRNTLSPGIVRAIARVTADLNVSRATMVTSKTNKRLIRSLIKIGFEREGEQRRYYGHDDTRRSTAVRLVMFRPRIDQLAQKQKNKSREVNGHASGPTEHPGLLQL
jgi:RimJ/RimL family protein N-acetyltransferase